MSEHERDPRAPVWPNRGVRPVEKWMKVVLVVVGGAVAAVVLYVAFFVAAFAMST